MSDVADDIRALWNELYNLRSIATPYYVPVTSYTPTYFGSGTAGTTTYTTQTGTYVQIGSMVIARFLLVWTAATGTGNVRIGGLPLAAAADTPIALFHQNVTFANGDIQGLLQSTTIRLFSPATNAGGTEVAIEAAGIVYGMLAYLV